MIVSSSKAIPQLMSQAFPIEVWKIGDFNLNVEMGTASHMMLINAARAGQEVAIETHLTLVPVGTDYITITYHVCEGWSWEGVGLTVMGARSWEGLTSEVSRAYHDLEQRLVALLADLCSVPTTSSVENHETETP